MKRFSEFMNSLSSEEASLLISDIKLNKEKCPKGVKKQALAAIKNTDKKPKLFNSKRVTACICAFFIIISCSLLGGHLYAAEAKEYKAAIEFFDSHNLSSDGLTRSEIKAVYKDITTSSFTYSKTAQVIEQSISTYSVSGYEILPKSPTPEDIERIWKLIEENWNTKKQGIYYETRPTSPSIFSKYNGEKLIWRTWIYDFVANGHTEVSDGFIINGRNSFYEPITNSYIAKVNNSGELIWSKKIEHGFKTEYISAVIENKDGSLAVISRGDFKYLVFSLFSKNGKEIYTKKTEVGNVGIIKAIPFDGGYIVQLKNSQEKARVAKLDKLGNITDSFTYSAEDTAYSITDIIEFKNKIYLSAYAVPKEANTTHHSSGQDIFYEIHSIINKLYPLYEKGLPMPSEKELTDMVRDNFSAVLLVCDLDGGNPKVFYSVKGAFGGTLTTDKNGFLNWEVENITTSVCSFASNYIISGNSIIYRYSFSENAKLINEEKTDKTARYYY